ncbi:MAG: glycosyltransferase [Bacteroidaceae bacterium]|nr:glycosyltransferase [Bacteroidaceae bacterium]
MAPIVIFAFNRPDALQRLADSLSKCVNYSESDKIIYIDGARNDTERERVNRVIDIARTITSDVHISPINRGLGASIIAGVTEVVNKYGTAIVLEDDLVPTPGFLLFMNEALERYAADSRIISICGYSLQVPRPEGYQGDVYLGERSSSWGWATWKDRWEVIDWTVADYESFRNDAAARRSFNRGGSDMAAMLDGYMQGRNRSWAIRFCYHQWRKGLFSVHPLRSLIGNEGFGADDTNCRQSYSRFRADFDTDSRQWLMPTDLQPNDTILAAARKYHSIPKRIYSKIRSILHI